MLEQVLWTNMENRLVGQKFQQALINTVYLDGSDWRMGKTQRVVLRISRREYEKPEYLFDPTNKT